MRKNYSINVRLGRKEFFWYTFYIEYLFRNFFYKFIPLLLIVLAIVFLSIFQYKSYFNALAVLGIAFVFSIIIFFHFYLSVNKQYEEYYSEEIVYQLTELGVEVNIRGENSFVEWKEVGQIVERKDCVYLYLNPFSSLFIPKDALTQEALDFLLSKGLTN